MHHVNLSSIPWDEQRSPGGRFQSFCRNVSVALGGIRNGGLWCGGHPFDVQVRRIPAGAAVCPFHSHLAQWELFLVQSGTATVRAGSESQVVSAGMVFVHPPGEPHQITNTGTEDLEILIIADNPQLDACYYPDSNKWGLRPPGKYFRMHEIGYFEGEEPALPDAPAYQHSGYPASAPLPTFASRLRSVAALPWESWQSPQGKFRGTSKELSIALGAKRNQPTGLGGHPFDLELNQLASGECGCPFHSHAAEWEMFFILRGTATVRADAATHEFGPGNVVLHPPGEAHQISNRHPNETLEYLLVASNAPVEYWHYPDSKKWGVRAPRTFFRTTAVDYWDGEE